MSTMCGFHALRSLPLTLCSTSTSPRVLLRVVVPMCATTKTPQRQRAQQTAVWREALRQGARTEQREGGTGAVRYGTMCSLGAIRPKDRDALLPSLLRRNMVLSDREQEAAEDRTGSARTFSYAQTTPKRVVLQRSQGASSSLSSPTVAPALHALSTTYKPHPNEWSCSGSKVRLPLSLLPSLRVQKTSTHFVHAQARGICHTLGGRQGASPKLPDDW